MLTFRRTVCACLSDGRHLYVDMSALTTDTAGLCPTLNREKMTGTLFGSEGLLALLDPTYVRPVSELLSAPQNADGEQIEEEGGLDIMALLEIFLREDVLYLPGHKTGGNFVLTLNNDTLNEIIGMIMPGAELGLEGVRVEGVGCT